MRLDHRRFRSEAVIARLLVDQTRAGEGAVEHLAHHRADDAVERRVSADEVFACDAPLLVRRRAERNVDVSIRDDVPHGRAVARRVDVERARPHRGIHLNRAGLAQFDARVFGELRVRRRANPDDHQLGGKRFPVCEPHTLDVRPARQRRRLLLKQQPHPSRRKMLRDELRHLLVRLPFQDARAALRQRRVDASRRQRLRHLHPDVSAADQRGATRLHTIQILVDRQRVGDVSQGEHAVEIDSRERRLLRRRARCDEQFVVPQIVLALRRLHPNDMPSRVQRDRLVATAQVDAVRAVLVRRPRNEIVHRRHDALQKVGQPTRRVRDILAAFQHDHVRVRLRSFRFGRRAHPGGVSADDDDNARFHR